MLFFWMKYFWSKKGLDEVFGRRPRGSKGRRFSHDQVGALN